MEIVADLERIRQLARDLPAVWRSSTTQLADRKVMLCLVIEVIAAHPVDIPLRASASASMVIRCCCGIPVRQKSDRRCQVFQSCCIALGDFTTTKKRRRPVMMSKSVLLVVCTTILLLATTGCGGLDPEQDGQLTLVENALAPAKVARTKGPINNVPKITKKKLSICFLSCMKNGFEVIVGNGITVISTPTTQQCTAYCAGEQIPGVDYENQEGGDGGWPPDDCTSGCMNACESLNPSPKLPDEEYFPELEGYCACLGGCGCPC